MANFSDLNLPGFRPTSGDPLPHDLTCRDLWDAWHVAMRYGRPTLLGLGETKVFHHERLIISVRPGDKALLGIGEYTGCLVSDAISILTMARLAQLDNGIQVIWDQRLTVSYIRGIIK